MFCWFYSLNTVILCATDSSFTLCTNKIYTYVLKKSYFIFTITKGSVNALMKLAWFSISNKVKNHWSSSWLGVSEGEEGVVALHISSDI